MPRRSSPTGSAKPVKDPCTADFPLLVSYHYLRGWDQENLDRLLSGKVGDMGFTWMLDSGAFSAKNCGAEIDLDEYMAFLHQYGSVFTGGYVALDVLGEPEATEKNLDAMYADGLEPMPVHVWGDDKKRMDYLFERSSKICLGGFKRPGRGPAPKEYVVQKMRWANGRDVHWLGHCRQGHVTALRPHSCDSSSWKQALRWGKAAFYLGGGRMEQIDKEDRFNPRIPRRRLLTILEQCGVTIDEWESESEWVGSSGAHHRVSVVAWVQYIHDVRKHFGTRYFMALCAPWEMHCVVDAVLTRRDEGKVACA